MIILTYDVGTTGVKTCLFSLEDEGGQQGSLLQILDSSFAEYSLRILPNGGAEQDPEEWWSALCQTTRQLADRRPKECSQIAGISFCAQAQSLVLLDKAARGKIHAVHVDLVRYIARPFGIDACCHRRLCRLGLLALPCARDRFVVTFYIIPVPW